MVSQRASASTPTKFGRVEMQKLPLWKRTIDIAFCCSALPLLATATFCATVLMSISSPGPIFFRQERIGYRGRRFRLYKFRTMHVGAETAGHQAHFAALVTSNAPMQKLDANGDARLIPCGWLFRASGLDELPQIINVLKGEMSLIGPRPCIPYEYENYSPTQRNRFDATPGLTGLWQVSGKNRTTFDQMIQLDIKYAKDKSLALDTKILFLTIPAMLSQLLEIRRLRRNATLTGANANLGPRVCSNMDLKKEAVVSTGQTS